ncbi:MAG: glycosyltransferase family 2 protein [Desulfobacterales bacterium]|nr:glycosyltransferase family 2 protein [Desulfobacterales bacterium]
MNTRPVTTTRDAGPDRRPAHSLAALIPARNEASSVADVVRGVKRATPCDVIVIDDASVDGTAEAARAAGARVLPLLFQQGAWGAIRTGFRYALKHGYDIAVTLDADGQHDPAFIESIIQPVRSNLADMVIGSCPARGSKARKAAWSFFRRLTMLGVTDLTSGFRAYNRLSIAALTSAETSLLDYQDIGVLIYLKDKGFVVSEAPVPMCERTSGHSRVFSTWWSVLKYMALTCVLCLSKIK